MLAGHDVGYLNGGSGRRDGDKRWRLRCQSTVDTLLFVDQVKSFMFVRIRSQIDTTSGLCVYEVNMSHQATTEYTDYPEGPCCNDDLSPTEQRRRQNQPGCYTFYLPFRL